MVDNTTITRNRSVVGRTLGVAFRKRTYANMAYLLARFPLGIAYFTVFVTGLSLGVALTPLVVGIPILAGVLALAGYVGRVEAGLLREVLGRDVTWSTADAGELALWPYLKTVATRPSNYLLAVFALVSFALGIALFTGLTIWFTLAVVLALAPVLYWMPGVEYGQVTTTDAIEVGPASVSADTVNQLSVTTLPEALVASVLGVAILIVGLHVVNGTAALLANVTEGLLATRGE
ncbi:MAG: sensor domain-containing protein [Halobacteriales archaeon]